MSDAALRIAEAASRYVVGPSRIRLLDMISAYDTLEHANAEIHQLTGIRRFFRDLEALEELRRALTMLPSSSIPDTSREWGDFQTPQSLADQVCSYLADTGLSPRVIVEPTFGTGNFILAALKSFPTAELVYGVEIQDKYEWNLKVALLNKALAGNRVSAEIELHQDDIFTHRFSDDVLHAQDILVLGNPPWVTSAELGALEAQNLPAKRNIKSLGGMDAKTGKSNFDIAEFVLFRMLELFSERRGALAMLCKNAVAKNLVEILPQRQFKVANIRALEIDAGREFGASVEASLLVLDMGAPRPEFTCQVASLYEPGGANRAFGWTQGKFVANIEDYEAVSEFDGVSPFVWRQGLKHDCAVIMELEVRDGLQENGLGEVVSVEDEWVYGLLKGSDLRGFEVTRARKKVIVTQHYLGEDTSELQVSAPGLWEYLVRNSEHFGRRKSSIYRDKPRFAIFGVGEYSFRAYKVAISGLHKVPNFSLVLPNENRPVMLDDTCYFLGFDTYLDALFTASLLNSSLAKRFLQSIVFTNAKRPYTKDALMRIDLSQVASRLSFRVLRAYWDDIDYKPRVSVSESDFEEYRQRLSIPGKRQRRLQLSLGL
ncbi:MAG: SAM-dependent methyltransferase [Chloroflexi bacterium]|nr:SAM-dependent methyltransferase [Chloroflexota bacterium]